MTTIREDNLLNATEEYIIQQCCCTALRPHGLSALIAAAFPGADPYSKRRPYIRGRNWAVMEDRPEPGSYEVHGRIICLFGQYTHGKPGAYSDPTDASTPPDTADTRLDYFIGGLHAIATELKPKSVAVPWKIGCGLAGGDWTLYRRALNEFAATTGIIVTLYRLCHLPE